MTGFVVQGHIFEINNLVINCKTSNYCIYELLKITEHNQY